MTGLLRPRTFPGIREFVCLMAVLTALEAVSIDTMLPALDEMGAALGAPGNAKQLIISSIFIGVAIGQLVSGPISDIIGRRRAVFGFVAIYLLGTLVAVTAATMPHMLAGRVIQGLGAAGPYVVAFAIIRDRYSGRDMAQINSWIMTAFILLPVISPLIGQGIIGLAGWRAIFGAFLLFAVISTLWFAARQPETLPPDSRVAPNLPALYAAAKGVLRHRQLLVGTAVEGLLLGAFIGYLSGSQPIFLDIYGIDTLFPLVFAALALFIGAAGVINAGLVQRLGMRRLIYAAFVGMSALSLLFLFLCMPFAGQPPLWLTLTYLAPLVFCCGIGFGNVAALAMEPVDSEAGLGASVFGGIATLMAVPIGMAIGAAYDETLVPLTAGFLITSALSLLTLRFGLQPR
ncbi:MAG: multidrug effflux MFS transporter [Paracoccaceae bacterium]